MLLKNLADSIGTAGGFAWPVMGLIGGSLGFIAGTATAIWLGAIASVLFTSVFIILAVLFYRKQQIDNQSRSDALFKAIDGVIMQNSTELDAKFQAMFKDKDHTSKKNAILKYTRSLEDALGTEALSKSATFKAFFVGFAGTMGSTIGVGSGMFAALQWMGVFAARLSHLK